MTSRGSASLLQMKAGGMPSSTLPRYLWPGGAPFRLVSGCPTGSRRTPRAGQRRWPSSQRLTTEGDRSRQFRTCPAARPPLQTSRQVRSLGAGGNLGQGGKAAQVRRPDRQGRRARAPRSSASSPAGGDGRWAQAGSPLDGTRGVTPRRAAALFPGVTRRSSAGRTAGPRPMALPARGGRWSLAGRLAVPRRRGRGDPPSHPSPWHPTPPGGRPTGCLRTVARRRREANAPRILSARLGDGGRVRAASAPGAAAQPGSAWGSGWAAPARPAGATRGGHGRRPAACEGAGSSADDGHGRGGGMCAPGLQLAWGWRRDSDPEPAGYKRPAQGLRRTLA